MQHQQSDSLTTLWLFMRNDISNLILHCAVSALPVAWRAS